MLNNDYSIEFKLILLILQKDTKTITSYLQQETINWPLFYKLIIRHRVWHQVLKLAPTTMPSNYLHKLTTLCKRDTYKILTTAMETRRIALAFKSANIAYCFVKGTLLNELLYDKLTARPCRDVDVWVDPQNLQQAINTLIELGYIKKTPTYELTGFKARYYYKYRHDVALYNPSNQQLIELHFTLDNKSVPFFTPNAVITENINLLNTPITTLQADYHLLYLMIHAAAHGWTRLRWLNDIALFINRNLSHIPTLLQLAKTLNCEHLVLQTFILLRDLFNINNPDILILIHLPSPKVLKLAKLSKDFLSADYERHQATNNWTFFLAYRYYLQLLTISSRKWHALLGDLLKIHEVFPYVTFPRGLTFLYYFTYPVWVIALILRNKRN